MNLNALHRRLLRGVLEIGNAFPLVITGGYAVQAHRLVDRFSRDIDMAMDSALTMDDLKFRLDGADWYDDQAFAEYGLSEQEILDLRRWAQSWSDDINRRLYAETYVDDDDDDATDAG